MDADVHDRLHGRIQEILDAFGAEHIGDLVRIADRSGDTKRQHAAVELVRRHQRRFDVEMRIDEARHDDAAGDVDLLAALIVAAGADDTPTRDGDVGGNEFPRDEIEEPPALEHDFRRLAAHALIYETLQRFGHLCTSHLILIMTITLSPRSGKGPRTWQETLQILFFSTSRSLSKSSSICCFSMISGGDSAMMSPVVRIRRPFS